MSLGLIFKICFVWSVLLAATALVSINLSTGVWHILKAHGRTRSKTMSMEERAK